MTRSVLCAVDISNPGQDDHVLKMAHRLADLDGAQLDVITVLPDFGKSVVGGFFEKGHHDKAVEAARAAMNKQITACLGADINTAVRHVVATGSAYEEVLKLAKESDCGLIVIGAHKPGIADFFLGPNAARIVRHSTCNVFVVRARNSPFGPATD
ncbi:universal stress protein [Oceaniglobus trochenteri]|uniref:universal stress protein n=1 Tax=Oceaniglobus trochenteri TaxID=2763260 RepID=UPI001CFFCE16|nr:universal stress protein [Oceaniglobus trochenteri]